MFLFWMLVGLSPKNRALRQAWIAWRTSMGIMASPSCGIAALTCTELSPSGGSSISASQIVFSIASLDDVFGKSMSNWSAISAASTCNCWRSDGSKPSLHAPVHFFVAEIFKNGSCKQSQKDLLINPLHKRAKNMREISFRNRTTSKLQTLGLLLSS